MDSSIDPTCSPNCGQAAHTVEHWPLDCSALTQARIDISGRHDLSPDVLCASKRQEVIYHAGRAHSVLRTALVCASFIVNNNSSSSSNSGIIISDHWTEWKLINFVVVLWDGEGWIRVSWLAHCLLVYQPQSSTVEGRQYWLPVEGPGVIRNSPLPPWTWHQLVEFRVGLLAPVEAVDQDSEWCAAAISRPLLRYRQQQRRRRRRSNDAAVAFTSTSRFATLCHDAVTNSTVHHARSRLIIISSSYIRLIQLTYATSTKRLKTL